MLITVYEHSTGLLFSCWQSYVLHCSSAHKRVLLCIVFVFEKANEKGFAHKEQRSIETSWIHLRDSQIKLPLTAVTLTFYELLLKTVFLNQIKINYNQTPDIILLSSVAFSVKLEVLLLAKELSWLEMLFTFALQFNTVQFTVKPFYTFSMIIYAKFRLERQRYCSIGSFLFLK